MNVSGKVHSLGLCSRQLIFMLGRVEGEGGLSKEGLKMLDRFVQVSIQLLLIPVHSQDELQ